LAAETTPPGPSKARQVMMLLSEPAITAKSSRDPAATMYSVIMVGEVSLMPAMLGWSASSASTFGGTVTPLA